MDVVLILVGSDRDSENRPLLKGWPGAVTLRVPMPTPEPLPWPSSLCHRCAAPPRYVTTRTSTFVMCPVREDKYPRQPVLACPQFRPGEEAP